MAALTGVDIAWDRPTVDQIKEVGAHFVARYFSTDASKNLRASEVAAYSAAGIATVVVWETTAGRATAGRTAGVADARVAEQQRKAVGLPGDMVIHFAVDTDTSWSAAAAYMAGVASVIGQGRTGVYGGYRVIEGAATAGYRYLWQTIAWSNGLWSAHATIRQTGGTTLSGGADWDAATVPDFGQYPRPVIPQEIDLDATQARQLAELHAAMVPAKGWDYSHGDTPDVHQTLTTAAAQATAAASGIKALAAKPTPTAPALTDAQVQQIASALAANTAFVQALATGIGKDIATRMQA
jgi:hypothetical protein